MDTEDLLRKVEELPIGLYPTYDRIIEAVEDTVAHDESMWRSAMRILSTLAFAFRQFSVFEMHNISCLHPGSDRKLRGT